MSWQRNILVAFTVALHCFSGPWCLAQDGRRPFDLGPEENVILIDDTDEFTDRTRRGVLVPEGRDVLLMMQSTEQVDCFFTTPNGNVDPYFDDDDIQLRYRTEGRPVVTVTGKAKRYRFDLSKASQYLPSDTLTRYYKSISEDHSANFNLTVYSFSLSDVDALRMASGEFLIFKAKEKEWRFDLSGKTGAVVRDFMVRRMLR